MKGDFHLIKGETEVFLRSGTFDIVGSLFHEGSITKVPQGKSIILQEYTDDCIFETRSDTAGGASRLEQSPYPAEWETLISEILSENLKNVILLGEMDTGKTFLCTYLANRIRREQKKVAVIDCDLGQSDIGPPGCLGSSLIDQPIIFMADAPTYELYFIGAHSPEGHLTSMLVGLQQLIKRISDLTDFIFIDTCGWTLGDGARILKRAKIELFEPDQVILLQRQDELEHLTRQFPEQKICRLTVAKKSSPTDQMVRKQLRENLSCLYFQNTDVVSLPFSQIRSTGTYFLTGQEISTIGDIPLLYGEVYPGYEGYLIVPQSDLDDETTRYLERHYTNCRIFKTGSERGHLVGLLDRQYRTMGLGIIEKIDFTQRLISLATPLGDISQVGVVAFGSLKYKSDGTEAGFMLPGQY